MASSKNSRRRTVVVADFDQARRGLEIESVGRGDRQECVACRRHRAASSSAHGGDRADVPQPLPRLKKQSSMCRGRATARFRLIDDDLAFPGKRIDDQDLIYAEAEGLFGLRSPRLKMPSGPRVPSELASALGCSGELVMGLHGGGIGIAGLAVPLCPG